MKMAIAINPMTTTKAVSQVFVPVLLLSFDMTCMRMAENTTSRVTKCKYVPVRIKIHLPTAMMYESTRRTLDTILVARQLNQQHYA